MIEIDGSFGEAGGQTLRTALALSTLTNKPFKITNIRKKRPKPGLKNQHLYCIKALQQICNAKVSGANLGSEELLYVPDKITKSKIKVDIKTAGSITLLLQSLLLPCLFSDKAKTIDIIGGTDVKFSPQIDYFKEIILPQLYKYAEKIELKVEKRGYFPKGNGKVILKIKPKYDLNNINEAPIIDLTEQGDLIHIKGISHASFDLEKKEVSIRQQKAAKLLLSELKVPINITTEYSETLSTGCGITLWAVFSQEKENLGYLNPTKLGSDELGEIGKRAEDIGKLAADKLLKEIKSDAAVDNHLADNLIPLMGLIPSSKIKTSIITEHTKTNIWITEKFLDVKFKIDDNLIECFKINK